MPPKGSAATSRTAKASKAAAAPRKAAAATSASRRRQSNRDEDESDNAMYDEAGHASNSPSQQEEDEDDEDDEDDEEEEQRKIKIPEELLTRILHDFFTRDDTRISKAANRAVGKYFEIFVQEAIARTAVEREGGARFLEVEDLEKITPQLIMDL